MAAAAAGKAVGSSIVSAVSFTLAGIGGQEFERWIHPPPNFERHNRVMETEKKRLDDSMMAKNRYMIERQKRIDDDTRTNRILSDTTKSLRLYELQLDKLEEEKKLREARGKSLRNYITGYSDSTNDNNHSTILTSYVTSIGLGAILMIILYSIV